MARETGTHRHTPAVMRRHEILTQVGKGTAIAAFYPLLRAALKVSALAGGIT